MTQTIKLKNSGTSSNTPSSLEHGELAINYADGKIFYKNSSNSIVEFANLSGSFLPLSGGSLSGNLSLGDNVKLQLGNQTNGDLQIFHTGTESVIHDSGTGNLDIRADSLSLLNAAGSEYYARFYTNGAANLYHNGILKINTTSTGIDVTGSVVADGLTSHSGTVSLSPYNTVYSLNPESTKFESVMVDHTMIHTDLNIYTKYNNVLRKRMSFNNDGDISFYNSAGSSQNFFWDSSTSRLGLGTTVPALAGGDTGLHIHATNYPEIKITNSTTGLGAADGTVIQGNGNNLNIHNREAGSISLATSNVERLNINSSGNANFSGSTSVTGSASANTSAITMGFTAPDGEIKVKNTTGAPASNLDFYTTNSSGTTAIAMRLTDEKDVSISRNLTMNGTLIGASSISCGAITSSGDLNLTSATPIIDLIANANNDSTIRLRENGTGIVGAELIYDGGANQFQFKIGNNSANTAFTIARDTGQTTFAQNATFAGTISSGAITSTGLTVDNITIDGNEIDVSSGNLTLDVAGDIILDADGGDIRFSDGGTQFGIIFKSGNDLALFSNISNGDLLFRGNDGGANITALTLDMSNAGEATFNDDINLGNSKRLRMGAGGNFEIFSDGSNNYIKGASSDQDLIFQGVDGGSAITALTLDMSNAGAATFNNNVTANRVIVADGIQDTGQGGSATIFNESGSTADFRVESNGNTHMLFVDGGSNRVGIGVSAPSDVLQVHSGSGGRAIFRHSAGDGGITVTGTGAGSAASVVFGNNWDNDAGSNFVEEYRLFMDGADDSLKFNYNANSSTALTLSSSGAASFTGAVTANAGVTVDTINIDGATIATTSGNFFIDSASDIFLDADGGNVFLRDNGTNFGNFNHNGSNLRIDSKETNGNIHLNPNGTGSVNVLSSLMVGSTTAPRADLHISGNDNKNLVIQNTTYQSSGQNTEVGLRFKATAGSDDERAKAGIILKNDGSAYGRGDLHFVVDSNDDNGNAEVSDSKMVITHEGRVGIGTTSPSTFTNYTNVSIKGGSAGANLDFHNASGARRSALVASDTGLIVETNTTATPIMFKTGATPAERMRIDSSGKFGFGTTVVNRSDFNIHGANRTLASTTSQVAITASDSIAANIGGSLHFGARYDTSTTDFAPTGYISGRRENATVNNYAGYLQFGVTQGNAGTIEAMRIDSSGRVGIGSATGASAYGTKLFVEDSSASLAIFHRTGSGGLTISADNDGAILGCLDNADSLRIFTGSAERMRIDSSGNLLVGKTSSNATTAGVELAPAGIGVFTYAGRPLYLNRLTSDGEIIELARQGTTVGSIGSKDGYFFVGGTAGTDAFLSFGASGVRPATSAGAARDAAIDLGGSTNRFKDLYLSGTITSGAITTTAPSFTYISNTDANVGLLIRDETYVSNEADITVTRLASGATTTLGLAGQEGINFYTSGSNAMKLTSGGNLLIGKTADDDSTVGIRMQSTGHTSIVKSGGNCLTLNRLSTDGSLLDFRKDTGTVVGSINCLSGRLAIGTGGTGLFFDSTRGAVTPFSITNNDGASGIDLGRTGLKFSDAHFSGTVNSGGVAINSNSSGALYVNGANGGINFFGGNNRIYFNSNRALEGSTDGATLQLGEGYSNTRLYNRVQIGASTPYRNLLVAFTSTDTNTSSSASGFGGNSNVGNGLMINNTSTTNNTYAPLDFKCGTNHVWGRLAYKATDTNDAFGQFEFITMDDGSAVNALTIASGGNGTFAGSCTATSFPTSSDARLKDNIEDAKDSGEIIDKIKVRQFDWKKTGKHQDYGMIAQELILEVPDAVSTPTEDHEMMGVDYSKLVPMLVKEIQQLRARVQTLEEEK